MIPRSQMDSTAQQAAPRQKCREMSTGPSLSRLDQRDAAQNAVAVIPISKSALKNNNSGMPVWFLS
jgi:hypothetical protein